MAQALALPLVPEAGAAIAQALVEEVVGAVLQEATIISASLWATLDLVCEVRSLELSMVFADLVRRGVLDSVLLAAEGLQPEASSGSAGAADTPASAAKANPAGESSERPWSNPDGRTQWSERLRNRALAP